MILLKSLIKEIDNGKDTPKILWNEFDTLQEDTIETVFQPKTPNAKLELKLEMYEISIPDGSHIIGRYKGVYVENIIDPMAGEVFYVESKNQQKGIGLSLFKDALDLLKSLKKDKVVLTGIHTVSGKGLINSVIRNGFLGKKLGQFDSATEVYAL